MGYDHEKTLDQQDPVYKMVDIACNTDLVLVQKHMPLSLHDYLAYFDGHPEINTTMATPFIKTTNYFFKRPRVRIIDAKSILIYLSLNAKDRI